MTPRASEPRRESGGDLFRWVFDSARDMIVLHEPGTEPGRSGPIIEVNDAACATSGYCRDELLAMRLTDLVAERDRHLMAEHLERVAEWGQATGALGFVSQQGRELEVELDSHRIELDGGTMLVSVGRDISGRQRLEQLKSDFMSTISHELRTPLAVIIGYGALLLRPDAVIEDEKRLDILRKLLDRAQQMGDVVEDLLLISQLQAEETRLSMAETDVGDLLQRCAALAHPTENHRLEVSVEPRPLVARLDPDRLANAVNALVSNAVKFSPEGGLVTLEGRRRTRETRICVSDQGVGMSASEVATAFDRFAQADMTVTRPFGGFGMGLFIAKRLVQAHGGRIEVDTAPGEGSAFTIVIPDSPRVPGPA